MGATSGLDELEAGDRIDHYEVVRRLGSGGYGTVYEALRLPLKKRTALKVLHRELLRNPEALDRFTREAEIVAQVEHPHIVAVFDVGVCEGQPYIAMEMLEGESLATLLLREKRLSVEEAVDLLLAVMSAVATVHDQGIVHRDLKPDNIFIARQATGAVVPKLLDFGIAKVREAERSITVTNTVMGTPHYMSPEQAQESKYIDGQSDQWALAVILFECLTGRCPFQGESLLAILNAIATGPRPTLRGVNAELPEGLDAVLRRAMSVEAGDRWPSVRAFGEALLPFASPVAQGQWKVFYTATAREIGRRSTVPLDPEGVEQRPPESPRGGTLEPATRSSREPGGKGSRRTALFAVGAALGVALVAGAWVSLRPGAPVQRPAAVPRATTAQRTPPAVVSPVIARAAPVAVPEVVRPAVVPAAAIAAPSVAQRAPVVAQREPNTMQREPGAPQRTTSRHRSRSGGAPATLAAPSGQAAFPNF